MRAASANHDGQLALVVHALRIRREHDGLLGTNDRRRRFEKHQRLFGDFVAKLSGVGGVIPADADDFRWLDGRDQANIGEPPSARGLLRLIGWLTPRSGWNFADLISIKDSIARRSG